MLKSPFLDCPKCFGNIQHANKDLVCKSCEYVESCMFIAENDSKQCDRTMGHVSYDNYSYSAEIATQSTQYETPSSNETDYSTLEIMEFLLDIDNYTAELLHEVLHGNCNTSSDLAKRFGVSRQAIHRKLVDCCTEHPQLRKLFITRLYRCRRLLDDSDRLKNQEIKKLTESARKQDDSQLEFDFNQ